MLLRERSGEEDPAPFAARERGSVARGESLDVAGPHCFQGEGAKTIIPARTDNKFQVGETFTFHIEVRNVGGPAYRLDVFEPLGIPDRVVAHLGGARENAVAEGAPAR